MTSGRNHFIGSFTALCGVVLVTAAYRYVITTINATTVALSYLLVVLVVSSAQGLVAGVVASIAGMLCFNFFFLPPVGTLTIADPQNWVALFTFLTVAIIASQLASAARKRASEAEQRREELQKLYQISQSIIVNPNPEKALPMLTRLIVVEFSADYCAVFEPDNNGELHCSASAIENDKIAFKPSLKFIQDSFTNSTHVTDFASEPVSRPLPIPTYAPLKVGVKPIGVLVLLSLPLAQETIEAIAGLVALAIERTKFLNEVSRTEALKQSDELKSALLAAVSHDLRTPLTSIRAAVDSLLAEGADWDKDALHEFHQIINEEVQRLTNLVQNLLQMARIEAGELHPQKEWTAVAELIANVVDRCSSSLRNHTVSVAVDEKMPLVKVDSLLVTQALSHLVENAAKYSPAGSSITICGTVRQNRLIISVKDEGAGIAHDDLAHIFDKFYRSSAKRVQERGGTGMGLSIARGIIEAHGGEISVESVTGRGATFQFSIPVEVMEQSLGYSL